jgi:hypothetical protein
MQLAAMGITLAIAITSGLVCGFIASRLPFPEKFFDDTEHFAEVEYGDDLVKYNVGHHGAVSHQAPASTAKTSQTVPDAANHHKHESKVEDNLGSARKLV